MRAKDALFLHMGPGMNSHIESRLFQNTYPNIEFWDQGEAASFSHIVDKALQKMALNKKSIIAHSFGGLIATEIVNRVPEQVTRLQLISSGFHFKNSFFHLLTKINPLIEIQKPRSIEDFWKLYSMVCKKKEFLKYYFGNESSYFRYLELAKDSPPLRENVFRSVAESYLKHQLKKARSRFTGPVYLYLGEKDPLIDIQAEIAAWKSVFPQVKIKTYKDHGHFIHIEDQNFSF